MPVLQKDFLPKNISLRVMRLKKISPPSDGPPVGLPHSDTGSTVLSRELVLIALVRPDNRHFPHVSSFQYIQAAIVTAEDPFLAVVALPEHTNGGKRPSGKTPTAQLSTSSTKTWDNFK